MDNAEARQLLALHRPGVADEVDERMAAALRRAQQDPELARWFDAHCRFYLAMQAKLKEIPVPADLKSRILRGENAPKPDSRIEPLISPTRNSSPSPPEARRGRGGAYLTEIYGEAHPPGWIRASRRLIDLKPFLLPLAAAAVVILLAAGVWSFRPRTRVDLFADGRQTIVLQAQRGYQMLLSTNLTQIHNFLVATNFPDYTLTRPLANLPALGCAMVDWRGHKVSMVCLAKGSQQLWLFVLDRASLRQPPAPGQTEFAPVLHVMTASWTQGDKVYILAGPGKEADLKAYLD